MQEPIRVLHVLGGLSLGGAESRIMDLYRNMDREKIQFDFLVHQSGTAERKPEFYDEEIRKLGGRIYLLPKFKVYNYFAYRKAVKDFFAAHHAFQVVQGHMTSTAAVYLPAAKAAGVPLVVSHARSAGVDAGLKGKLTKWMRRKLLYKSDLCFACSKEAGTAVFGRDWLTSEKAVVLPNAIEAGKFVYNEEKRREVREEMGIEDCFVIGHVGRFHPAKNHEYLLEVFRIVRERLNGQGRRAVLLLLGDGAGRAAAREKAADMDMEQDVMFLGNKGDVETYYQAMDYFVFPSRFEGLPGTVVEAQAAGLRCIISDRITPEVGITGLVHYESIEKEADIWAEYILDHAVYERENMLADIKKAGFDAGEQAAGLTVFYETGKLQ